jgi:hypothetical protein
VNTSTFALASAILLATSGAAFAAEAPTLTLDPTSQPETAPAATEPAAEEGAAEAEKPKNLISLEGGIDITHAYFFRGYKQQEDGVIMQPYVTFFLNLPQLQDVCSLTITPYVGTWNSTSTKSAGPKGPKWLFESDVFVGTKIERGDWTLDMYYQYSGYPSSVWVATQELDATLSYNDAWFTKDKLHLPSAVNPHVGYAQELNRSDNILNGAPGSYLEFGIAPSVEIPVAGIPITVSAPNTFGLSLNNFYLNDHGGNQTYGYFSTGLSIEIPLEAISGKGFGDWRLVFSGAYQRLDADSLIDANDGHRDVITGAISFRFSY